MFASTARAPSRPHPRQVQATAVGYHVILAHGRERGAPQAGFSRRWRRRLST